MSLLRRRTLELARFGPGEGRDEQGSIVLCGFVRGWGIRGAGHGLRLPSLARRIEAAQMKKETNFRTTWRISERSYV